MSSLKQQNSDSITWWGIGLSILATNIAYDYIHVGASMGFTKGLALGSYEWTGSLFMIFVLLFIFPTMMSSGVKTTPEYLGLRYNEFTRRSIGVVMVVLHVIVVMVPVLYSAAHTLNKWYGLSYSAWLIIGVMLITLILLFQNIIVLMRINIILISMMMIVGLGVMIYCFYLVGGLRKFAELGAPRINAFLSSEDDMLPWHSVIFGGLWVAHAYYWSCNQNVQQFVLSSNTLSKAQFGFLLTATIKLIVPFIIIVPGITLFILNGQIHLADPENAFSTFIVSILPERVSGIVLIVYLITLVATFSSVGFATINIILNDLLSDSFKIRFNPDSLYRTILLSIITVSLIGAYFFKSLVHFGLMEYNQVIMNLTTPTIVALFIWGIFFRSITTRAANIAILVAMPLFFLLRSNFPSLDLLNTGGIVFIIQSVLMAAISYFFPVKPKVILLAREIRFERNLLVVIWSIVLITFILTIYTVLM